MNSSITNLITTSDYVGVELAALLNSHVLLRAGYSNQEIVFRNSLFHIGLLQTDRQ